MDVFTPTPSFRPPSRNLLVALSGKAKKRVSMDALTINIYYNDSVVTKEG